MTATLVDSNVLIDVLDQDPRWGHWSGDALIQAVGNGAVFVNQIVYAEVSIGFPTAEECDSALEFHGIEQVPLPWPAAFRAGRAFVEYRRRGGARMSLLPDFLIGAHAAVSGLRVLTRDPVRIRSYFPTVELITPG